LLQITQLQRNTLKELQPKGCVKLYLLAVAAITKNCIAVIISAILKYGIMLKVACLIGNGKGNSFCKDASLWRVGIFIKTIK
jgi:hypothetical protein